MIWLYRIAASVILGLWLAAMRPRDNDSVMAWIVYSFGVFCALMAVHPGG